MNAKAALFFPRAGLAALLAAALMCGSALVPPRAEAATCRDFIGDAESRTRDVALQKAQDNAARAAQVSLGSGIALQQVVNGYCRQDSDWSSGAAPGSGMPSEGYGDLEGNIQLGGTPSPWKCTVTVKFCTIDAKIPQPSVPGFTPPPTFKPKL